jgi:hypothetical protein
VSTIFDTTRVYCNSSLNFEALFKCNSILPLESLKICNQFVALRLRVGHDSGLNISTYDVRDLSEKKSKLIVVLILIYLVPSPFPYKGRRKAE